MSRLYVSLKSSNWTVKHNGVILTDSHGVARRYSSPKEATAEANRLMSLARMGVAPRGLYEACSLIHEPESRPFKLHVSGNGY